jgi:hypothetical protein
VAGHPLLLKGARNFNLRTVDNMSEQECYEFFVGIRWNHGGKQVCPECGCVEHHYVIRGRRQWRCKAKGCGRTFSVTSATKFADRKLSFKEILRGLVIYVSNPKGLSASAFSSMMGVCYGTGYVFMHKLREALWQTRDLSPLSGLVQVDGSHFCGRPYDPNLHGGKHKKTRKIKPRIEDATTYHPNRRIAIVLRAVYPGKGRGAVRTIVEVATGENAAVVNELARRYITPGSIVMTDEGTAFAEYASLYDHRKVNHNLLYMTKDGTNNNQAESFWARCKRMWRGQLHRLVPRYLPEYLNECAWREDVRKMSQRERLQILMHKALRSGRSRWWCGYFQGNHRPGSLELAI